MVTVFLDLDGVLCNFADGADLAHGKKLDWTKWNGGLHSNEFWAPINAGGNEFWENLEPYPWTKELLYWLMKIDRIDLYICSSPAREPCATGKINWIQNHLPVELHRKFFLCGYGKRLLARPGRILIDDSDKNCSEFVAAGGKAVLFPRKWNEYIWQIREGIVVDRVAITVTKLIDLLCL